MRADRLVATLLLMQSKGRVTAKEIANELEVSIATARRDLEALSTAGIPVYPQPGRNGGWELVGGARTDLSGLTANEAQALFLLAGPAAAIAPDVKSALRKLVRALPDTFRADAEAAAGAVVIDPARWGEHTRERPELVQRLQQAVVRRSKVRLRYRGTERLVEPWGLVDKDERWYLIAGTDNGRRTFRLDRIDEAELTDEEFARPADFDVAEAWEEVVDWVERQRSQTTATVRTQAWCARILADQFGRQYELAETLDDGRVRVRLSATAPVMIAQILVGWGKLVELEGPAEVRAELVRLATEALATNA